MSSGALDVNIILAIIENVIVTIPKEDELNVKSVYTTIRLASKLDSSKNALVMAHKDVNRGRRKERTSYVEDNGSSVIV